MKSIRYPWRDANLCESRCSTGQFCEHLKGHSGAHSCRVAYESFIWQKNYPYYDGEKYITEYDA